MTDEDTAVDSGEDLEKPQQEEELSEEEQLMAKLKEAVTVEKEEIGSLRLKLSITIPRDTLAERMGEQFAELKRDALVPGFRKGRAPMKLVEKRFGSEVGDQVVTQLVTNGYLAAIEKEELKPLGDPLIWAKVREKRTAESGATKTVEVEKLLSIEEAAEHIKLPDEGDLSFFCEIELKPEFELPKLDGIPLKKPAVGVKKADVNREIDYLRSIHGTFSPVEDGAVEADDLLFADVKLTVGDDEIISEENFDLPARDTRVRGLNLEGFGDAVVGKRVGDEVTIDLTIPEDHENLGIRGKNGRFSATIREIKHFEKAPFDETFLAMTGYESEKDLRAAVRTTLETQLDSMVKQGLRGQTKEYLLDNTTLELPEGLPQRLTEQTIERKKIELMRQDMPQEEVEKAIDKVRAEAQEQTVRELKLLFILEKIAEDREVHVGEEEINGAIAGFAARQSKRFDRVRDELSKSGGLWNLYLHLRDEKVLDSLIESAEITEVEVKPRKKQAGAGTKKKKEK